MKTVYKVVNSKYEEWQAPEDAIITRPFTIVEPPTDEGTIITGYDWVEDKWQYTVATTPERAEESELALMEMGEMVALMWERVFPEPEEVEEPVEEPEEEEPAEEAEEGEIDG